MKKINQCRLRIAKEDTRQQGNWLSNLAIIACLLALLIAIAGCTYNHEKHHGRIITPQQPLVVSMNVTESHAYKVVFRVNNHSRLTRFSVLAGNKLLVDNVNVPELGGQTLHSLIAFESTGEKALTLKTINGKLTLLDWHIEKSSIALPSFFDITEQAGIDKVPSLKYGGPSVADIDQDGDYDFVVNNHNAESSKIYWNNGDFTVTKHSRNLSRWLMQDLHGTALGDYDNDGDLDLMLTRGGGNGTTPSVSYFYVNDNGNFVRFTGDAGIDKGGRGRGARFTDVDLDGDLDLFVINETSLTHSKPQHMFFENKGKGRFVYKSVPGIEDVRASRALITDFNNDGIDDVIMYGPLTLWQGNGDFTYTDVSSLLPLEIKDIRQVMAIADIDIDNDGDLDLYLARGKEFEHGFGEAPSLDFDPISKSFAIKTRGYEGRDSFSFSADDSITLNNYYFLGQMGFRGKDYPIYLGASKAVHNIQSGGQFTFNSEMARGWPEIRQDNGVYFGYLGDGKWNAELVRNGNIFWSFFFTLQGVTAANPAFEPENRNIQDVLLENRDGRFFDVSAQWEIPLGGNALGVTTGDFNNDSYQDLFVYRWGRVDKRIADVMLLNTGKGKFETSTMHGASDHGGPGFGDMGQAFDFNLDGYLDILSGSEHGYWYLYENNGKNNTSKSNYALINVGYSPKSNVDALGAYVTLTTPAGEFRKRVGSAGEIFSQSFLNIVHFGLGNTAHINKVQIRWRNGETLVIEKPSINQIFTVGKHKPSEPSVHSVFLKEQLASKVERTPFVNILDKEDLQLNGIDSSKPLTLTVKYHAGTGQNVIAADEGGMQFWLRHRSSGLIPLEDRIEVDSSVLYTEQGSATASINLQGLLPSSNLKPGEYYMLRVVFTSSDGNMYEDSIQRIKLY
ncbi:CRTAC1 family protein [Alteromonas macleodii]|uniref:Integrin/UnbV like protein n=1 Tax=Alteromonas macleodii TaxID=28108 RepID=A0A6T9XXY3_ALTMA|nr:CRTAC1 family protein [Alteromonas macleodii]CAB9493661.1 Integrin/UnbV like protein [Alteromonas macleodii]